MALLESFCGCGLAISSAVLGVYLLVAYIIAFTIELWWILDSSAEISLPIGVYLLCLEYCILVAISTILLHGLSIRRATSLLIWLFMMGVLLGPEAGLVLYLSIHYWRVTSVNGLIEITCWACRLLVNAIGFLCVQSLYSTWREEKSVMLRLRTLKSVGVKSPPLTNHINLRMNSRASSPLQAYINNGYEEPISKPLENLEINPDTRDEIFENSNYKASYIDPYFTNTFNEFNASSFDRAVDARLSNLSYSNIKGNDQNFKYTSTEKMMPKTRSLINLSNINGQDIIKLHKNNIADSLLDGPPISRRIDNGMGSLDRKIIKNKNLKILKNPFSKKKSIDTVNIYRINPSKKGNLTEDIDVSVLNSQLKRVYGSRGMYIFDENTQKIVYYPPEFFQKSSDQNFRSRLNSYGSNLSRSSLDSEDIKHISDIAL